MITNDSSRIEYISAGLTQDSSFSFPHRLFAAADLEVYIIYTNGVTIQVPAENGGNLNVLYCQASEINGDWENGATVRFYQYDNSSVVPAGAKVVLTRQVSADQALDLRDSGIVPTELLEAALDKLTMLYSQLAGMMLRNLQAPISDSEDIDCQLPPATDRAGKYLGFDTAGNVIATAGPVGASDVPVSGFGEQLVSCNNAESLRAIAGYTHSIIMDLFSFQDSDPAGFGVYVKKTMAIGDAEELMYKDNLGNVTQITNAGVLNVSAVLLAGSQIIAGIKTFTDCPVFSAGIDLAGSQIKGMVLEQLEADPANPVIGQMWMRI